MEDSIEVILQDPGWFLPHYRDNSLLATLGGAALTASYGLWTMFVLPGFRKVPMRLKVPYLPSSAKQTANVMKLLEGRRGRLADLGSGDGRLVFAACSAGFQCTGFEINSILLAYSRSKAKWKGIPPTQVNFVSKDFWTSDVSKYRNVTVFLAPGVVSLLMSSNGGARGEVNKRIAQRVTSHRLPLFLPDLALSFH
ncbi:adenine nucleotide translocase lysine N-methyltransferase isoform X3 [Paramormyrops kingsleyae]|uniref:adenine nucleotide translocase lysine N-methyltransferase isoform X3 n=1 Tax=Paramormyrops kingsleyae TaxID=1676925 RepID=UPI003B97117E